jgi:hypothetical protein
MFHAPSPKNTNRALLFLNARGELMDRRGNFWGKSQIMAMDAALKPRRKLVYDDLASPTSGEPKTKRSTAEWAQSHARAALYEALGEACREHELTDDEHKELRELIDRRLKGEDDENKGMGAVDADEDDEIDAKVREYLKGRGLADDDVEKAIALARKDREAARDSRPQPGTRGGFGGRFSDAEKAPPSGRYPGLQDVMDEYGATHQLDLPDYSPDPSRFGDPVRERGERAAERLPGGGTSRRLPAGDVAPASDAEDIEAQVTREYGGAHIKAGMFG